MTIKEAAAKSGLTQAAIYKQIKEDRALGRFFERDSMGKWQINPKLVKKVK